MDEDDFWSNQMAIRHMMIAAYQIGKDGKDRQYLEDFMQRVLSK